MNPLKSFKPRFPIHAVLWDIDGTLVQTEDLHKFATSETFKQYGVFLTDDDFDELHGKSMRNNFSMLQRQFNIPDLSIEVFYETKLAIFEKMKEKITLTSPSLRNILQNILEHGCKQAAVSNGARRAIDLSLEIIGPQFFSFSLAIEDTIDGKPSPTPYLMAAEKLGVLPQNCLVIEDSLPGIQSGLAAGMHVITCPFYEEIYKKHKEGYDRADLIVRSLDEIDWDHILS